ncbi:hypothetical protein ACOSQ2_031829 [Xanthoceras sorbifolium]
MDPPPQKINLILCGPLAHISDIKLIRTDTTLDLSQKAEKESIEPRKSTRTRVKKNFGNVQAPSAGPRVPKANKIKKSRGCRTRVKITSFLHTFWTPIASYCNGPSPSKNKFNINHNEFNNFS